MGLGAPTERERYAIRRHFDVVCFSSLYLDRRVAITPSLQDEGHAARSTFLASFSSSYYSSSSPPFPFSSSSFPLYYLPKAAYVRRKSFVLNLMIRSRTHVDVEENG